MNSTPPDDFHERTRVALEMWHQTKVTPHDGLGDLLVVEQSQRQFKGKLPRYGLNHVLAQAMAELAEVSPDQAHLLRTHYQQGQTVEEMVKGQTDAYALSERTIKRHIRKAVQALAEQILWTWEVKARREKRRWLEAKLPLPS